MKSRVLTPLAIVFCFIAITSAGTLAAQSFSVELTDPSPFLAPPTQTVVEHHGKLTNNSSTSKTIVIRYFSAGKSINHAASMCADLCYELPESFFGEPYDLPTFTLAANTTIELKAILNPLGYEGISTLNFNIFDAENPADSVPYAMTFNINVANTVKDLSDVAVVEVGPNPSSDLVSIASTMLSQVSGVDVYSADGRILQSQSHDGSQRISIDVSTLSVGSYHVILTLTSGAVYRTPISVVR